MPDPLWRDARFDQWKTSPAVPAIRRQMVRDLEAYFKQPIAAVAETYWRTREHESPPGMSPAALEAYYAQVQQYIYESSYFETLAEYQWYFSTVVRAARQCRRAPVLDFGGGAGGLTVALSRAGIACDYADVPGPTSEFTRWRLQARGSRARVLDATGSLPQGAYGAIVTLDVFEHLPDLRDTIRRLAGALVPDGWLISKSTFAADDPLHLPHNLVYADLRALNRLLADEGFAYRGRLRPDPLSEQWFRWTRAPSVLAVRLDGKLKYGGRFVVHQLAPR